MSYYEASAGERPRFPSLAGAVWADVCVVGGGFTGLSAALHLGDCFFREQSSLLRGLCHPIQHRDTCTLPPARASRATYSITAMPASASNAAVSNSGKPMTPE